MFIVNFNQFVYALFILCLISTGSTAHAELGTRFKVGAGYAHYDLDVGEDTSSQPLGFTHSLPYGTAEIVVHGDQLFLSASYLQTTEGDIEQEPFGQTLMGPGTRSGDFKHNQLRVKLGYRIVNTFSLYLGYERSLSELSYAFEFPKAGDNNPSLNPGDQFNLNAQYEFSTSGPLLGMNYAFTPKEAPLYLSLNLDVSELDGKLENTNNQALINGTDSGSADNTDSTLTDRSAVATRVGLNLTYRFTQGQTVKTNIEVQNKDFGFNSENIYFAGVEYGF